jgi:hypothetical protein
MNLIETIGELRGEKDKLERAIAMLEQLRSAGNGGVLQKPGRGRKSVSAEERQEISVRMKKYWERRLSQKKGGV